MNNAGTVLIHRFAGLCLPCTRWPRPTQLLRPVALTSQCQRAYSQSATTRAWSSIRVNFQTRNVPACQFFSTSTRNRLQRPFQLQQDQPTGRQNEEKGLAFQEGDLEGEGLHDVFGAVAPPPRIANRFLRVLHGRRNDGTLDLELPPSLQELTNRYPYAMGSALHWLRQHYPIDEDAAILARIEREEGNQDYSPAELQQRAQDLGLYAPQGDEYAGPQSGHYQAKASETEGDVFGQSEIDRIRAENIAEAEAEEAELQSEIDRKMAHYTKLHEDKQKAIAEREEQAIETSEGPRPPNVYEKWVMRKRRKAETRYTLESPEVADLTFLQRVLPSAIFVALVCTGCYLFAQYWVPPKRSERFFPDVSLSMATIGVLVACNVVVFTMWRLPVFWPILNRYFISTPAYPRAVSMLLNSFSHQDTRHILQNMLVLFLFGPSLHEEVGRGVFMAIYLASGSFASLASLTGFTLRRVFVSSGLGASGSTLGILGAFCWFHAK